MAWLYLALASLFEIALPLGFKLSQQPEYRIAGVAGAGTFVVGVVFFGDAQTLGRWVDVAMIEGGVVVLKLAH